MTQPANRSTPVLPVYLALGLLLIFIAAFLIEFARTSGGDSNAPTPAPTDALTADSYMDIVTPLLAKGDPVRGEQLTIENGCHSCHVVGVANKLAPDFEGVADRAKIRRPPLQAPAYIYESIIHPAAFTVPGYIGQMPRNFAELPEQDLADLLAYLMTKSRESQG